MIIYAPKKRTEPYVPNEQVKQIYEKHKDYIEKHWGLLQSSHQRHRGA